MAKGMVSRYGTEPVPKDRGHRFQQASMVLMFSFFTVYSGYAEEHEEEEAWHILLKCLWMMIVLSVGEIIRRIGIFIEELRHLQKRYDGHYMRIVKKVFTFNKYAYILIIPAFLLLLFSYIFWPDIIKDIVGELKYIYILVILIIYPVFSMSECTWSRVEEMLVLEKEHQYVGNGLAWSYYIGYLKLVLPCQSIVDTKIIKLKTQQSNGILTDSPQIRNLQVSAVDSQSIKLEWEPPAGITDIKYYMVHYSLKREGGVEDLRNIKWDDFVLVSGQSTTVKKLFPLESYIFKISAVLKNETIVISCFEVTTQGDIADRMKKYEQVEGVEFPVKKLFILIPETCYIPATLGDFKDPFLKPTEKTLPKLEINRAGNVKRVYQNSVYQVKIKHGEAEAEKAKSLYVALEGCTPVLTLHEMAKKYYAYSEITEEEMLQQLKTFIKVLKNILKSDPKCNDLCELIYYKEKNKNGNPVFVSDILKARTSEIKSKEFSPAKQKQLPKGFC